MDVERMPVLFVGHGSPMNAIEHNVFTQALSELSARLPRPKVVCVVSAHWVTAGSPAMTAAHPETIPDFCGSMRAVLFGEAAQTGS
jgi:4,5-DOPA dioxygenase extradiol